MRRNIPFIIYLAGLSALSGWLLSGMSWIGRIGIRFMHREYTFLKTWYKGGAVVFAVLMALFFLQWLADTRLSKGASRATQIVALFIAVGGLWLTYTNFRTDFTHRILKESFHLGAYVFWLGWMSISLFLLATRRIQRLPSEVQVER